ncbi:MAG: hypothetical protein ACOX17_09525 [Christensenellales bacterium]|jgi:hypothetical protein
MKKEHISGALNILNDDIIEETNRVRANAKSKRRLVRPIAAAACICLIVVGVFVWRNLPSQPDSSHGITMSDKGVTIPTMEVSLSAASSADMLAFFIYHGNCYVHYDWIYDDVDIIGKRLGTATGLIDEWTLRDGYVECAGSVKGDFYEVKGYDPSFMLCMKHTDGSISLYVCDTGITLKYGSELYEDRLHLSGNYTSVQYESRKSWNESKNERYKLEKSDDLICDFIDGLNAAEFIPRASVPFEGSRDVFSEMEIYHLYFNMQNGTTVHLRLWKDGYVLYQGLLDVCVQVKDTSYNSFLEVLENHTGAVPVAFHSDEKAVEDCMNDPELGKYVPSYTPDNMIVERVEILYYLDAETAKETGTKELTIEYSNNDGSEKWYAVTVTWASEYGKNGWEGPMMDASELNEERVSEHIRTTNSDGDPLPHGSRIELGVWYGDVSVVLSGVDFDAETAYQILKSVNPDMK